MGTEADKIMKLCQKGTYSYAQANDLHAECYGMIGKLQFALIEVKEKIKEKNCTDDILRIVEKALTP